MKTNLSGKTKKRLEELREKYGTEEVFAVPYSSTLIIPDRFTLWGGSRMKKDIYGSVLPYGKFIPRAEAEEDMSFQQIIPYAFITDAEGNVFTTLRVQGDDRLQGSLSIGTGGHINPCDDCRGGVEKMVLAGLKRELGEETTLFSKPSKRNKEQLLFTTEAYGVVRDLNSSTPDHIGLVFNIKIESGRDQVAIKETDTLKGKWFTLDELTKQFERLESWSQYIVASLIGK